MELTEIFKYNPQGNFFTECQKKSKLLSVHITGKNWKDEIVQMDEFETEQKKNLRQKYSRSNRDIFARIHRPIDKVFSANGGSLNLNLPEAQEKKILAKLAKIRKGMTIRKWIKSVALPAYQIDPNGVVFMEVDANGEPYPVYTSTCDIFYYEKDGREINMIIFKVAQNDLNNTSYTGLDISTYAQKLKDNKNTANIYRVVDAISDKLVYVNQDTVELIPGTEIRLPFGQCPAFIVSDIFQFNDPEMLSPDSDIVELANSILTDNSVFEIWKKLHMFPKHWRFQSLCPTCQGNKTVSGNPCMDCSGTGYQKRSAVRDELIIPLPDEGNRMTTLPDKFDGYSTPPIEAWTLATQDSDRLFQQMFETMWGYSPVDKSPNVKVSKDDKTATQVLDESGEKALRLYDYSAWAETTEKFIIDMTVRCMVSKDYKGASVLYGDRYVIEGPDTLWQKYAEARTKGSSDAILDTLLLDYYEAKYFGDPVSLNIAVKQMRVEPWVHWTINQVQGFAGTNLDKTCKTYFTEWKSTVDDLVWLTKDEKVLRQELITFATPKMAAIVKDKNDEAEFQRQLQAKPAPANNAAN